MQRVMAALIFLVSLVGLDTTANAMSLMPGYLAQKGREITAAERQEYQQLLADKVVVKKSERRLYLVKKDQPFRTYTISLGFKPVGHKQRQGDGRTPEGRYYLDWRISGSKFHKALHVSYPSYQDQLHAKRRGDNPGGMIMVHGQPPRSHNDTLRQTISKEDWTQGCIAVSNLAIEEIWSYTRDGTPIEILP